VEGDCGVRWILEQQHSFYRESLARAAVEEQALQAQYPKPYIAEVAEKGRRERGEIRQSELRRDLLTIAGENLHVIHLAVTST
jgi:hypothetical protein